MTWKDGRCETIRWWLRRADGDTLVQTHMPVNRFPDFVRYAVQRIKLFCPSLGKAKIAEMLARAGLHIGRTIVLRILKEKPVNEPRPDSSGKQTRIVAKYPSHTWHADLTAVPGNRVETGDWKQGGNRGNRGLSRMARLISFRAGAELPECVVSCRNASVGGLGLDCSRLGRYVVGTLLGLS